MQARNIVIEFPDSCTEELYSRIAQLNEKLNKYVHAPTNLKEIMRMQPFADDPGVVRAVLETLNGYDILPEPSQQADAFFHYDIVAFWYCVALLALSGETDATEYLTQLARTLISKGPGDLNLLRRITLLLADRSHLDAINNELSKYYDRICPTLAAYRWLKEAGISVPQDREWEICIKFTTDGNIIPPITSHQKEEVSQWFCLSIAMFSPCSLYGDYSRTNSYEITLRNGDNSIAGMWNEGGGFCRGITLGNTYEPKYIHELFDELEKHSITLETVPPFVYASKGIAQIKIWEWLSSHIMNRKSLSDIELLSDALDILRQDGSVADTLAEMRNKWGTEIPVLLDKRFDNIALQYIRLPHEAGIAALGQELTACGYCLYDLDGEDIYLLELIPMEETADFERRMHDNGVYCKMLKQNRRAVGQQAKEIDPGKQMECKEEAWAGEGYYTSFYFAGDFASGYWRNSEDEKWQGPFIADLHSTPPTPVKLNKKDFRLLTYSAELDFYAAFYRTSLNADYGLVVGGKNPAEADKWPRLCNCFIDMKCHIQWCGHYLCIGDTGSATLLLMTEQGVKDVSRIMLSKMTEPASFAMDGQGNIYIQPGSTKYNIIRYDGKGKYTEIGFSLHGWNAFGQGSLPVPGTTRMLLLHSYNVDGGLEPALLDLDMTTRQCRIAPLKGMGYGFFRLSAFTGDWALIEQIGDYGSHRFDYAQLWNRMTGEVLRIRPGMFGGGHQFEGITALTDGTVAIKLLRHMVGRLMYYPEDFWNFLRKASRVKKLNRWLCFPKPYPDIGYVLPPESDDPSLILPPPYTPTPPLPVPWTRAEAAKKAAKATPPREEPAKEQAADSGIELCEGGMRIHGKTLKAPLSYPDMLKTLGMCRRASGPEINQGGKKDETPLLPQVNYLIWDELGIMAVRSKKNPYLIAAIYFRMWSEEPEGKVPMPQKPFKDKLTVDGKEISPAGQDTYVCSGKLEITILRNNSSD